MPDSVTYLSRTTIFKWDVDLAWLQEHIQKHLCLKDIALRAQ